MKKARADIAVIASQLKIFYANEGRYPTSAEGIRALVPRYIESLPRDPWGQDYQYEVPGREGAFDVISFGADGREGGDDVDRDLTNHDETEDAKTLSP
jgi:general secretion pathway protein G